MTGPYIEVNRRFKGWLILDKKAEKIKGKGVDGVGWNNSIDMQEVGMISKGR